MSRDTIFKSTQGTVPHFGTPEVVQTAQSALEYQENQQPALSHMPEKDVVNITRPVRGRPY